MKDRDPRSAPPTKAADEGEKLLARRRFLQTSGLLIAGAALASCEAEVEPALGHHPATPRLPHPAPPHVPRLPDRVRGQYPAVPDTPTALPQPGVLNFFSLHEARTVEAFTARLLPGDENDPGAREAGVVFYIDGLLSYPNSFGEGIYRDPPFAETYEGDAPPADEAGDFDIVWVAADEAERYGYQSILTPRDTYRSGLASIDRFAGERFGANFVDLSEEQQDELIGAMLDETATGFDNPTSAAFFHVLRRHTSEGLFSDPVYGGNRDMIGWRLIGYPGAQRAYTETEIRTEGFRVEPQSILDMHEFHAGEDANPEVILPVSGSRMERE